MRTPRLEAAFLSTSYRVETPEACFALRIGFPDPAFDEFLTRQGASNWGIVTACNPEGILTPEQNAQRHGALRERIEALGWRHYPASNHADSGPWPVEPGYCVLDTGEAALVVLAAEFSQAAVVCGESGQGGGRLVWLKPLVSQ